MEKKVTIISLAAVIMTALGTGLFCACGATDNESSSGDADTDGDTDGDTDSDSDSDGDSIYDVQQGNISEGTVVSFNDVIVTSPTYTKTDGSGYFFVEEPAGGEYSGIVVFMYSDVAVETDVAIGDVVNVAGAYTEYYGLSEITLASLNDIEITGTADPPAPEVVNPSDVKAGGSLAEAYESVLIEVEDVIITNSDVGYGQFEITGGLPVDDYFFTSGGGPSGSNIVAVDDGTFDAVVGILLFTSFNDVDEFKLGPRDLDDYDNYSGGDTDWDIYDIQQGNVPSSVDFDLPDVIVTSPLTWNNEGFFVQESAGGEYSGIYVHIWNPTTDAVTISVGDVVTLTGSYYEFFDCSQFQIDGGSAVNVTGTASVPAPEVVAAADVAQTTSLLAENYEGVLIQVQNVTTATAVDGFGQFLLDDAVNGLMVDDEFFTAGTGPNPTLGHNYTSITGPLHYDYDFKLLPRTLADLVD
jgi:hypothetical protein